MATELNLTIDQGSPFTKRIRILNENGSNYDLTGHTAKMQLRQYVGNPDVSLELTTENSFLVIDIAANSVDIVISHLATSTLTYSTYVYDLEIINPQGVPKRVIQGSISVSFEVTR